MPTHLTGSNEQRFVKMLLEVWHGFTEYHLPSSIEMLNHMLNIIAHQIHLLVYMCYQPSIILYRANILLDKTLNAKIGDFGFSRQLPTMPKGYTLVTAVRTPMSLGYAAPELDGQHHSPKSDVYSYGMVNHFV